MLNAFADFLMIVLLKSLKFRWLPNAHKKLLILTLQNSVNGPGFWLQCLFQLNFLLPLWTKRIVNVVITNTLLKKTRRSNSAICYGVVPNVWSTISIVLWGKTIFLRFDFSCPIWKAVLSIAVTLKVESVQDFLSKLDMKPCVHLVEISIFSLNHVIIRLT